MRATPKTQRASGLAWIPSARALAPEHPFRAELLAARESGSVAPLLAAMRERFEIARIDPSVHAYAAVSLGAERAVGALRIAGIADALAKITPSSRLFGRFGDTPLPAIEIGGANGVPFWLDLASGRVITLHHDATLHEKAAACRGTTLARAMAQLVSVGSALSLEQLLSLAARLHAVFGDAGPTPRPLHARVVIDALGLTPAEARKAFETLPFELFDLRASDLDALPKPGATAMPTKKAAPAIGAAPAAPSAKSAKRGRARPPHPRLAPLLERAAEITQLDLSNTMLAALPEEIERFTALERLDLSDNPRLDWDDACARLALLPALREVRLLRCDLEALPEGFAKLASLDTIDLSGSAGVRGDNHFQNGQALPIVAKLLSTREELLACRPKLPALRTLRLGMYDAKATAHEALASPAFAQLESLELWISSVKAGLGAVVAACPALRSLRLWGVYGASLDPLTGLRALEELELDGVEGEKLPDLSRLPLRRLVIRRARLDTLALGGLASLESLDADVGQAHVRSLPTSLRTLTLRSVERPDAALTALTRLESLELAWDEPAKKSLALSSMPALREVRARGEGPLGAPKSSLRVLEALEAPAWLASQEALERLSLTPRGSVSHALDVALALPRLAALTLAGWGEPFVVPDVFADLKALREVRIVGRHASPSEALERIAKAPSLEVLEVPSGVTALPASLSKRPLRELHHRVPRPQDGPPLDLAQAFGVLAPTGLRELVLTGVETLPRELGALAHLETLRFGSYTAPRLPDAIAKLGALRLVVFGAPLTAPDRKRVLALVPRAALRERR